GLTVGVCPESVKAAPVASLQLKLRAHHRRDFLFQCGGVVVAFAADGAGVNRVDLHDTHPGVADGAELAAAVVGDLPGARGGVLGGLGEHLDLQVRQLRVQVLRRLRVEHHAFADQLRRLRADLADAVDVGRGDRDGTG